MSFNFTDLSGDAVDIAPRLLGSFLVRTLPEGILIGKIVETEAYHQSDAASHSYRGKTDRNSVMFGPPGFSYVYFTYGMHYCFNVVTGEEGEGSAVLIRALEPLENLDIMRQNRGFSELLEKMSRNLCNGPAKLCQAFRIDKALNKHDLSEPPLQLIIKDPLDSNEITNTTRIGITKETHKPWRFYIKDNEYVSKR